MRGLRGLTAVASGGSPQGLAHGYDDLLALAESDPGIAGLLMPAGGLVAEQVPWFARAGVRQFHVGGQVRPGGVVQRLRGGRAGALLAAPGRRRGRPGGR